MDWDRFMDLFGVPGVDKVWHFRCRRCEQVNTVRTPIGATEAPCAYCPHREPIRDTAPAQAWPIERP